MTVRGGETDLGETPVVVELKSPLGRRHLPFGIRLRWGAHTCPGFRGRNGAQLATVLPSLAAGSSPHLHARGTDSRQR